MLSKFLYLRPYFQRLTLHLQAAACRNQIHASRVLSKYRYTRIDPPCSTRPSWQQPQSTPALAEAHAAGGSAHSQLHCQHRYRYSQQA